VSVILLLIGVAEFLHLSSLLTSMVLGIVLGNLSPDQAHDLSHEAEKIFSPVILFFFVLFGAGMVDPAVLAIGGIILVVTTLLYIIGRGVGKYLGTRLAANIGDNPPAVKRYLGLCLFSQAGVAVGLSVVIADRLNQIGLPHYGFLIVGVIGISTLIFQIFGPLALKFAIHRAGEANNNGAQNQLDPNSAGKNGNLNKPDILTGSSK
jgi:NhaP-type Na+/H+ or K+/H+ antiporter